MESCVVPVLNDFLLCVCGFRRKFRRVYGEVQGILCTLIYVYDFLIVLIKKPDIALCSML